MNFSDWVALLALVTLLAFLWGVGDGSIAIRSIEVVTKVK